ncbi:isoprenylcysteine carboxylmethyltransferase family protein [Streptosporangium sp. NPDC000239]|uniref:isoprenylcysteine carboxylmethyltransferase family protein n=1 Tax=Streptosporangium sp. NPDC000239 TaxID=3154248 RepID=UPI00331EF452
MTGDPVLVRGLALAVPVAAVLAATWRGRVRRGLGERDAAAAILATLWNLEALIAVNLLAQDLGWWRFTAVGALYRGVPIDLLLGWALLWGAVPGLVARRAPIPLVAASLGWLDLAVMPLAEPVVVLGEHWLAGEAVAMAVALLPGLLVASWTAGGRRLPLRAAAQIVLAAAGGMALPIVLTGAWRQPTWVLGLMAQALAVPSLLGLAAVREFALAGRGTPLPYDPPERLVVTGPYAYVRNPMQAAMTGGYLLLALLDPVFLAAALVAFAYGAGLAAWHEGEGLTARFGGEWAAYRRAVRAWVPRWRPVAFPGAVASVYVATTCGICSQVGGWIVARRPAGLRVLAAEDHPAGLRRITYESADGRGAQGVAAIAHVLTHIHLGWALAGWTLMIPGVGRFAQLCMDAFGGAPRTLAVRNGPSPAGKPGGYGRPPGRRVTVCRGSGSGRGKVLPVPAGSTKEIGACLPQERSPD